MLLAAVGCESTDVWVASDGAYPHEPCGTSWATVIPGPPVLASLDKRGDHDWYRDRCDLSRRTDYALVATRDWPEPPRPSLERPRYVRVVRSPEVFVHYRTGFEHHHHHDSHHHWHGW
jgi:hypothetical protein